MLSHALKMADEQCLECALIELLISVRRAPQSAQADHALGDRQDLSSWMEGALAVDLTLDTFLGLAENPCSFGTLVVSRSFTGASSVRAAMIAGLLNVQT